MDFGQCLFIGIQGTTLSSEEEKFIIENNIGGICLFARNCESPEQLWELNRQIQRLRFRQPDQAPIFIGIDMEGGRVHRLKPPFTQWPAASNLGHIDSATVGFNFGLAMGRELNAVGFNLDFAPCVDTLTNKDNPVIGDRAISHDPEIVAKIGSSLVRGYIKSGVIPCAKHFPGHGNSSVDSHKELPLDNATLERLNEVELIPFKKAFKSRLDLVMTCHMKFPNIDDKPVTLSKKFISQILREDCRYRGLVITDDLGMGALTDGFTTEEIAVQAMQAGCDLLLYCNVPEDPPKAIEAIKKAVESGELDKDDIGARIEKITKMKKIKLKNYETLPLEDALEIVGSSLNKELAEAIAAQNVSDTLLERF